MNTTTQELAEAVLGKENTKKVGLAEKAIVERYYENVNLLSFPGLTFELSTTPNQNLLLRVFGQGSKPYKFTTHGKVDYIVSVLVSTLELGLGTIEDAIEKHYGTNTCVVFGNPYA